MDEVKDISVKKHVIASTLALTAVPAATVTMAVIWSELRASALVIGLCAAVLSYSAALLVAQVRTNAKAATAIGFFLTLAAATLNSPLSLFTLAVFDLEPMGTARIGEILGMVVLAFIIGLFLTVPIGTVFGLLYATLFGLTYELLRDQSREALERTMRICGTWLVWVNLAGLCVVGSGGFLPSAVSAFLMLLCFFSIVLGGATALGAHQMIVARRRWFLQLLETGMPGWSLEPKEVIAGQALELRPLFARRQPPPLAKVLTGESVLMRTTTATGPGVYRSGERREPVAIV